MRGRLLTCSSNQFVVGCRLEDLQHLPLGALVHVPWLRNAPQAGRLFGVIAWVSIPESSMARQVAVQTHLVQSVIQDQRTTLEPAEVRVLVVGYQRKNDTSPVHLLPPYPPEPLSELETCSKAEVVAFTQTGRLGYLRHLLRATDLPIPELLAAHLHRVHQAHLNASNGDPNWVHRAVQRIIHLLRDDPTTLMWVMDALSDALPQALAHWTLEEEEEGR